jgi:serine-type D-Ala-D-Ala carboxypeptidase (penicillin-binding protein 5/6)
MAIVLGTASENDRANEAQKLLNWGYTAFEAVKLFDAGQAVVTPKVWKGAENTAKLGRTEAIVVALPAGSAARLKTSISRADPLLAPLVKGRQAAMLKVSLDDQAMLDVPLVALEGVAQAGLLGRAWDAMRLWIK